MGRIFKIEAAPPALAGKTLKDALLMADKTGVLSVPAGEISMQLPTKIRMGGKTDGRK